MYIRFQDKWIKEREAGSIFNRLLTSIISVCVGIRGDVRYQASDGSYCNSKRKWHSSKRSKPTRIIRREAGIQGKVRKFPRVNGIWYVIKPQKSQSPKIIKKSHSLKSIFFNQPFIFFTSGMTEPTSFFRP